MPSFMKKGLSARGWGMGMQTRGHASSEVLIQTKKRERMQGGEDTGSCFCRKCTEVGWCLYGAFYWKLVSSPPSSIAEEIARSTGGALISGHVQPRIKSAHSFWNRKQVATSPLYSLISMHKSGSCRVVNLTHCSANFRRAVERGSDVELALPPECLAITCTQWVKHRIPWTVLGKCWICASWMRY